MVTRDTYHEKGTKHTIVRLYSRVGKQRIFSTRKSRFVKLFSCTPLRAPCGSDIWVEVEGVPNQFGSIEIRPLSRIDNRLEGFISRINPVAETIWLSAQNRESLKRKHCSC